MDSSFNDRDTCTEGIGKEPPFYMEETKMLKGFIFSNFDEPITKKGYISKTITEHDFEYWNKIRKPIFVSAQTGSGKNTLIEDFLIPYLKNTDKGEHILPLKILILSNRLAVNFQSKKRFLKNMNLLTSDDYDEPTDEDIKNFSEFGIITILSYQSLLSSTHYLEGYYTHVICDECHFFTSDAPFDSKTGRILETIVYTFHNLVRIYLSATMDECIYHIVQYEKMAKNEIASTKRINVSEEGFASIDTEYIIYEFEKDYSYLNIQYFSEHLELVDIMKESTDKWLIFIDNKKRAKALKETLEATGVCSKSKAGHNRAMFIDSTKKNNKSYLSMLSEQKIPYDVKVLISTSVIDNGINFDDNHLKNIVVEDIDKTKCLQLVGRKRVMRDKETDLYLENVNLYIKIANESDLKKRINSLNRRMKAFDTYLGNCYEIKNTNRLRLYQEFAYKLDFKVDLRPERKNQREFFNSTYYNGYTQNFIDAKNSFYRDWTTPEVVHPNRIAVALAPQLLNRYTSILQELEENGTGRKYLEYQLSWFEKSSDSVYKEVNDISLQRFFYILQFLETARIIPKAEQPEFSKDFARRYVLAYGKRKEDNSANVKNKGYGKNIINKILKKLQVGLSLSTKRNGDWEVKRRISIISESDHNSKQNR